MSRNRGRYDSTSERRLDRRWENGQVVDIDEIVSENSRDESSDSDNWQQIGDLPAVSALLAERELTHGSFLRTAAVAQSLKISMRCDEGWSSLSAVQREALEMICSKIARVLTGDPAHEDHFVDIIGYAELALRQLRR